MDRLQELRTAIAENTLPGGSAFGRAAAEVIRLSVTSSADQGPDSIRTLVDTTSTWLMQTKPSMTSVRTVADLAREAALEDDPARTVATAMDSFISESESAIASIADHAAAFIKPGSRVLFHSYSGSLIQILRRAGETTPDLEYLFTESRPYRESRRIVAALQDLPVTFVGFSDASVVIAADQADLAIVGADALFSDGSFANKTGTLPLALACKYVGIPLYVVTELSKLYTGDPRDVSMEQRPAEEMHEGWDLAVSGRAAVTNQFFEVTPADLVTAYLTDRGVLSPSALSGIDARG
jgi:translation initiation factor 2B subunit (eIF-2B alpha/beta/delta family)